MELPQLLERYAEDETARILVEYLQHQTNPSTLVFQLPFKTLDTILALSDKLESFAVKGYIDSPPYLHTLKTLNESFADLTESQRLPVLAFYLSQATMDLENINPHSDSGARLLEIRQRGEWLSDIFELSEVEPYLRNPDYASLIFHASHAIYNHWNDYELGLAISEDFLSLVYSKLRRVARDFKTRCGERNAQIKEELMMVSMHPDRIGKLIEAHGFEVLEWGV
jgi:hypothetical protein